GRSRAGGRGGQIARALLEKPAQRVRRHETAVEERGDAGAQPPFAELREDERDIVVVARDAAADAESLIKRRPDQPRDLRVVRQVEARVDVGLEWKLPEQREAEGVDRRDSDV